MQWIYHFLILFLFMNSIVYSSPITFHGKTVINKPTRFVNQSLDLRNGYFYITPNGSLEIVDSVITSTISPQNPYFLIIEGSVILKNNRINVNAVDILSNPLVSAIYYVLNLTQGNVNIVHNQFKVDEPYSVGFFLSNQNPTSHLIIHDNKIDNFHGGIMLRNSRDTSILNNELYRVSFSNILNFQSNHNVIAHNTLLFPGNNNVGDGINIIDSNDILINKNLILTGSCYAMTISNSKNITVDQNYMMGSITYAAMIDRPISGQKELFQLMRNSKDYLEDTGSETILISNNYFSQNRYGLAANNTKGLSVKNNIFIQKFSNSASRKFWTNNSILFDNVSNLAWNDNVYKEAFTQDSETENTEAMRFVIFPVNGGVDL